MRIQEQLVDLDRVVLVGVERGFVPASALSVFLLGDNEVILCYEQTTEYGPGEIRQRILVLGRAKRLEEGALTLEPFVAADDRAKFEKAFRRVFKGSVDLIAFINDPASNVSPWAGPTRLVPLDDSYRTKLEIRNRQYARKRKPKPPAVN